MQTINLSSRTTIPSLAAGLILLLLLGLLNSTSTGVSRGGDDDGSGIGGTGRMATPGSGSGFGGTGYKPFLGLNSDSEVEVMRSPSQRDAAVTASLELDIVSSRPIEAKPVASPVVVMANSDITRDSSALNISETIQQSLDTNALYFQRLQTAAAKQIPAQQQNEFAMEPDLAQITEADSPQADELIPQQLSWNEVASFLLNSDNTSATQAWSSGSDAAASAASASSHDDLRLTRPERIQRPELPPVQRIRPIQRASILPPRVQPLRL